MEKRHINQNLIKDLENRLGVDDIFSWLDLEGERLAQYGMTKEGYVEFTSTLKSERGISEIKEVPGGLRGEDASIVPGSGAIDYVIHFKQGIPENHMRFAIAHEIGHTYWFKKSGTLDPLSPFQVSTIHDASIEFLCDKFAAALLLPRNDLLKLLEKWGVSPNPEIPPLHLIRLLAQRYKIAEQAVARRLFYQLIPRKYALLCIKSVGSKITNLDLFEDKRLSRNLKWKVVWCALPDEDQHYRLSNDVRIPFKTSGRAIPDEMIPSIAQNGTCILDLDLRWWKGVQGQPSKYSRISFKYHPRLGSKEGFGSQNGNIIYLALPTEESPEANSYENSAY